MADRTTDLETVKRRWSQFTWGRVEDVHSAGPYDIVEFRRREDPEDSPTSFHVYVDGKDTHRGSASLDGALLIAIAYRGCQSKNDADWMARAAAKLLATP